MIALRTVLSWRRSLPGPGGAGAPEAVGLAEDDPVAPQPPRGPPPVSAVAPATIATTAAAAAAGIMNLDQPPIRAGRRRLLATVCDQASGSLIGECPARSRSASRSRSSIVFMPCPPGLARVRPGTGSPAT